MIYHVIYTQATKDKVIKSSQWKDDMYISLNWNADDDAVKKCLPKSTDEGSES
jgi:hypothetical protein